MAPLSLTNSDTKGHFGCSEPF